MSAQFLYYSKRKASSMTTHTVERRLLSCSPAHILEKAMLHDDELGQLTVNEGTSLLSGIVSLYFVQVVASIIHFLGNQLPSYKYMLGG
jgi:hypothetical protein